MLNPIDQTISLVAPARDRQDAMNHADPSDREQFLNRVAVGRLKILNAIASSLATPLQQRLPKEALPTLGEGWHEKYSIQSH